MPGDSAAIFPGRSKITTWSSQWQNPVHGATPIRAMAAHDVFTIVSTDILHGPPTDSIVLSDTAQLPWFVRIAELKECLTIIGVTEARRGGDKMVAHKTFAHATVGAES